MVSTRGGNATKRKVEEEETSPSKVAKTVDGETASEATVSEGSSKHSHYELPEEISGSPAEAADSNAPAAGDAMSVEKADAAGDSSSAAATENGGSAAQDSTPAVAESAQLDEPASANGTATEATAGTAGSSEPAAKPAEVSDTSTSAAVSDKPAEGLSSEPAASINAEGTAPADKLAGAGTAEAAPERAQAS